MKIGRLLLHILQGTGRGIPHDSAIVQRALVGRRAMVGIVSTVGASVELYYSLHFMYFMKLVLGRVLPHMGSQERKTWNHWDPRGSEKGSHPIAAVSIFPSPYY